MIRRLSTTIVAAALFAAACGAAEPVKFSARAFPNYLSVAVELDPHAENANVQVAVTALDSVPESWAFATVYHQWGLEDPLGTERFIDEWPNMPPGRYRVAVTLSRGGDEFTPPAQEVTVVP